MPVTQNNDDDAMRDLIERHLNDAAWRGAVGRACRAFACRELTWETAAAEHLRAYKSAWKLTHDEMTQRGGGRRNLDAGRKYQHEFDLAANRGKRVTPPLGQMTARGCDDGKERRGKCHRQRT